jgi:hypothetical protein
VPGAARAIASRDSLTADVPPRLLISGPIGAPSDVAARSARSRLIYVGISVAAADYGRQVETGSEEGTLGLVSCK